MEVTPEQFAWLDLIKAGETLMSFLDQIMERYPDFDFAVTLATFVGLGVIVIKQNT